MDFEDEYGSEWGLEWAEENLGPGAAGADDMQGPFLRVGSGSSLCSLGMRGRSGSGMSLGAPQRSRSPLAAIVPPAKRTPAASRCAPLAAFSAAYAADEDMTEPIADPISPMASPMDSPIEQDQPRSNEDVAARRAASVDATGDMLVATLKAQAAKALGLPLSEVRIIAHGRELFDDETLAGAGLQPGDTVHTVLRLRPRGA